MNAPESLLCPDLAPVFDALARRLERDGLAKRGRVRLPASISSRARYLLSALVDSPVNASFDSGALEDKLVQLGLGGDLASALAAIGHPVSPEPAQRRLARQQALEARHAARDEVASWDEPWAAEWLDGMLRAGVLSGLGAEQALDVVRSTRAVLARVDAGAEDMRGLSRVDLAASVLGDSHSLDTGTRQFAAVTRALTARHGGGGREVWERAGVFSDRVSVPVLTWGLLVAGENPMSGLLSEALALEIPLHLSQMALREHPVVVEAGLDVLVTENPRMVEAACERRTPFPVVALNGNPAGAAQLLVRQLLDSGARLRYHGDFDAGGLRICARMHRLGLVPWRMGRSDYLEALTAAQSEGARLPASSHRSPPTPWDPSLQAAYDEHRLIVHEERLIGLLLR